MVLMGLNMDLHRRLTFAIICLVCVLPSFVATGELDVVILFDSSDSHRSNGFTKEKAFLENFAKKIFVNGNHMALFTFGKQTDAQFFLNSYKSLPDLQNAIKYLWFSTGDGGVANAINDTIHMGFSEVNGNRECVPNVLLVLTHSSITNADVIKLTREVDKAVVGVFIIDMDKSGDPALFQQLSKNSSRVIEVNDFNSLLASMDSVVDKLNNDRPRSGCGVLGTWQAWTKCSASCGEGLRFRVRECKKVKDSDKDCGFKLTEDSTCSRPECRVVLDGGWSDWSGWDTCSKTCNNGTQTRTRICDFPIPTNGGKPCVGKKVQTKPCSTWKCPDCNRKCPAGGTLSKDCETCLCSSVTLYGRATYRHRHFISVT